MNENEKNIEKLKKLLQLNKNNVAAFIGAGTSIITGFPNWQSLLIDMKKYYNIQNKNLDRVNALINNEDFIKAASEIFNNDNDINKYNDFLCNRFKNPVNCQHYSLHDELIKTFNNILTTNFDTTFKSKYESLNEIIKEQNGNIYNFKEIKLNEFNNCNLNDRNIVYLHGNWEQKKFILREEEYQTNYKTYNKIFEHYSPLEGFLIFSVFSKLSLVYIGFSFNDYYFVNLLKKFYLEIYKNQCEEDKKTYGTSNIPPLPDNFVIISDKEIKCCLNFDYLLNQISDKKKWINYVNITNNEEITFKQESKNQIELDKNLTYEEKLKLIDEINRLDNNKKRKELLNQLNFKIIFFEESFVNIEYIIKEINKPLNKFTDTGIQI